MAPSPLFEPLVVLRNLKNLRCSRLVSVSVATRNPESSCADSCKRNFWSRDRHMTSFNLGGDVDLLRRFLVYLLEELHVGP